MKKRLIANAAIVIAFIITCVILWTYSRPVTDVLDLKIETNRTETNGPVFRIFWDDGSGLNIDNTVGSEFVNLTAEVEIPAEVVQTVDIYRVDPISVQEDIAFTAIYVNGMQVDLKDFASWIGEQVQVEAAIVSNEKTGAEELSFTVTGEDSQLYMNEGFVTCLRNALQMRRSTRVLYSGLAFLLALFLMFYKEATKGAILLAKRAEAFLERMDKKTRICLGVFSVAVLFVVTFIVMHQYIFGQKFFIFSDKGSDSYYQTYPQLVYYARCIQENIFQGFNFWTGLGMGAHGAPTISIGNWVCYFGVENVAYLMGISQAIKIFLAGLCFYGFMRLKGVDQWYSLILALGFAFCGHMTMRACWENYPNEVLLFAFWLFTFELFFQKKDIRWLLLSTTLFFYNFGSEYYMMLYTLLMVAYGVFRYVTERRVKWKLILIVLAVLSLGILIYLKITNFLIVQNIIGSIQSDRFQNGFANITWTWEAFLPDFSSFPLVFARTVGLYTLGLITLADPVYYCGIFVLLLIPVAFYCLNWKNRIYYAVVFVIAAIYTFTTQLRVIANGCADEGYKLNSFWISIFMLLLVSQIDWKKLKSDKRKSKIAIVICSVAMLLLLGVTHWMTTVLKTSEKDVKISIYFILMEFLVISGYLLADKYKALVSGLFAVLVAVEVAMIAYPIYNDRKTEDGSGYLNDGTIAALDELYARDDSFYRIDKKYMVLMSDSLAQGYNGTACYVGGTGVGDGIRNFYSDLGLAGNVLRIYGASSYTEVQELISVKYALTRQDNAQNYGFTPLFTMDDIYVYENQNAVTNGFVYDCVIDRSRFELLSYKERQQVLLEAALVEDGSSTLPQISEERLQQLHEQNFDLFDSYEVTEQELYDNPITDKEMLAVKLQFANQNQGVEYLCHRTVDGKQGSQFIMLQDFAVGQVFEIIEPGVNQVWVEGWADLVSIRYAKIPKDIYFAKYEENVRNIKEQAVQVESYNPKDNHTVGTFLAKEDGILYLPIPSGSGFQIYIDGEYQNQFTINDCFIGINVTKGTHELEYIYPDHGTMWDRYQYWLKRFELVIAAMVIITVAMYCKKKIKGRG